MRHRKRIISAPNLILTKTVECELKVPRARYEAIVTVERFRGDHKLGLLTGKWKFKNHITDAGLDAIKIVDGTPITTILSHMGVGTDSTAPADGDTALGAEISPAVDNRTSSNGSISDVLSFGGSFLYSSLIRTRLFLEAQGNGNLTELGWFSAATAGTMFSRMLFKDGGGTPTTIVKTSSDQLRVTYEIRATPPVADVVDTINISGTDYDYTIRPANTDDAWGFDQTIRLGTNAGAALQGQAFETDTLGAQTGIPAGSGVAPSSVTFASYSNGNFYRDAAYVWEPGVANFATGIGSITCFGSNIGGGSRPLYQISFDPKFDKDNTKRLSLTIRHSWGRV